MDAKKVDSKDFKAISLLGKGTFAKVYLVRKISNGKLYAMKIISKKIIVSRNLD